MTLKDAKMIDWTRARELYAEFGDDGFDEVIDLFFEEVDEVIARLPDLPGGGALERDLHFLRSGALNLGFAAVAELAGDGEKRLGGDPAAMVDTGAIASLYAQSKSAFQSGLGTLGDDSRLN